jgi:DNA-binding transcriptional MerR regulator/methylmalonyl-CoA mutase cobalamin-binding subunit
MLCLLLLPMKESHHSLRVVTQRTGLSTHVVRVWEKRYGAVKPERTATNRRLYSDAEIERLTLLRLATSAGHSIGSIANLPLERLKALVAAAEPGGPAAHDGESPVSLPDSFQESCLSAVRQMDVRRFEEAVRRALIALGHQGLLQRVIAPLAQTVGERWRTGELTAAHEHFLTASLKVILGQMAKQFATTENAPGIIVATPAGQLHELGALMANTAAAHLGWRTIYLGASLPAAEIAGAAAQNRINAVALSIVYPEDDPNLPQELLNLRSFLPPQIHILAGGRAAWAYRQTLTAIGAIQTTSLDDLCHQLDTLRTPVPTR